METYRQKDLRQSRESDSSSRKKKLLRKITHRIATKARNRLSPADQIEEKLRRQQVIEVRKRIQRTGSVHEKKIGLPVLLYGSLEWMLIYVIRGTNEGINSAFKKRGDLLGDGQATTWIRGQARLRIHIQAEMVGMKITGYIMSVVTGFKKHCLKWLQNWRVSKKVFCLFFVVRIRRKTPGVVRIEYP